MSEKSKTDAQTEPAQAGSVQRDVLPPGCACVHPDGQTCARIRDGFEPDDRRYWMYKRTCECVCHREYYEDDDD